MNFGWVIILLTALLLVLILWGLWEGLHPVTERSQPRRQPRTIYPTYGPGYSLLQWKVDDNLHE